MKRFLGLMAIAAFVAWRLFPGDSIVVTGEVPADASNDARKGASVVWQSPSPKPRNATEGRRSSPLSPVESGVRNRTSDALALAKSGDTVAALRLLKTLTEQEPANQRALAEYAQLLSKTDAPVERVLAPLLGAVKLDPNDGESLALLNEQFEKANRLEDGIDFLKSMPDESASRLALGDLLLKVGRPKEAAGYLQNYAKTNRTPAVLGALGAALLQSGDSHAAGATFKELEGLRQKEINRVMEEGKENPTEYARKMAWTQLDLAAVHLEEGNLESATKIVNSVLAKFPDDEYAVELKKKLTNRGT